MTTVPTLTPRAGAELAPLHDKWGWILALGIVYVIVGLLALGSVVMATAVSVFVVGIMMVIAGVAEVINAFQIKTWGKFLLWLVLGVLYVVGGFAACLGKNAPRNINPRRFRFPDASVNLCCPPARATMHG